MSLVVGGSLLYSSSVSSSGSMKTSLVASMGVSNGVGDVKARKFGTEIGSRIIFEEEYGSVVFEISGSFCRRLASAFALRDFTIPVVGSTTSTSTCWKG